MAMAVPGRGRAPRPPGRRPGWASAKNFLYLTSDERDQFFEALFKMKAHMVNPMAPAADKYSVYDQLASLHWAVLRTSGPLKHQGLRGASPKP